MPIIRLALAVLAISVTFSTPATARQPQLTRDAVEFEGKERVFSVHFPPVYDGNTPLPLVLVLHGGSGNGPRIARQTNFAAKADVEGFVVVFPDGQDVGHGLHYWNARAGTPDNPAKARATGDDVAFIAFLIDRLTDELVIDERRIYVAGFSNGAGMTHRLACELSDRIAAAAAVASGLSAECSPTSPVSVLQMTGSDDPNFTDTTIEVGGQQIGWWYAIEFWSDFNECPAEPVVEVVDRVTTETHGPCAAGTEVVRITLEGVGHIWPGGPATPDDPVVATDVVWDFFARHPRGDQSTPVSSANASASSSDIARPDSQASVKEVSPN